MLRLAAGCSGECRTTFHLVDGYFRRISYGAVREAGVITDASCAQMVRGCLRMLRKGGITTARPSPPP